ncbi:enoyl-[acyl-carrier protein] reductase I [Allopseudospirillum japonicum]|uniref:Enoyl-[acyl-carrier-protein] reductase [NADH] n=1 Tax=Allopseudospirillum japonicum TaxID=64971 RepID=A0A1H6Q747_9GAMM|nr:enoyl-ACP reductase FabI [Allopseudospirillum japonicum]SEI39631.1 enoyl-[acyl-carrier protein] reductase I [Allopseudospirillum japonicum]
MTSSFLQGKKGLVIGIANDQSIAYGCAKAFRQQGAELAVTYLNEKARPHVQPLAEELGAEIFAPCNVSHPGELEGVFEAIEARWGKLDFLLHSIAFCPMDDLHGRVVDSSAEGFKTAMDVSCHSFIRMAKLAEPLMAEGGSLLAVSYYGAEKVVSHYNVMGPVKAALETTGRYLAAELGPQQIRVNILSPGPIMTRAASGIGHFDELMHHAEEHTPVRHLADINDVGHAAAFLASDAARSISATTFYIDGGYHAISG